jgi:uncharacterized protein
MVAVQQVHAAVQARLEEERKRLLEKEGATRPVWQVTGTDGSSLLKSATSARSKLGREISTLETAGKLPRGSLSLDQVEHLMLSFPDLGRFRIVCDFTCDVDCARKTLLTGKPPSLLGKYRLGGAIKDYVYDLDLRRPARGHRAFQFAAEVPSDGGHLLVEVQLMTLLQAAWDRRNHPLYEWSREGGCHTGASRGQRRRPRRDPPSGRCAGHPELAGVPPAQEAEEGQMSQPLFLTYLFEKDGERRGLSIHLTRAPGEKDLHELLPDLHAAAQTWASEHPDIFLRSDLGVQPQPGSLRRELASYLYASGEVNGPRLARHLTMLRDHGQIHRFTLRPGAAVEGDDLVGRERQISDLLAILKKSSCQVRAARRYGKTSLLRHVAKTLSDQGEPCVFVDVSAGQTAAWFLVTLARAAMEAPHCRAAIDSLPELDRWPDRDANAIEKSGAGRQLKDRISDNPWSFGRRLLDALGRVQAVLLIDEFSLFLRDAHRRNPDEARQLADLLALSRRSAAPTRQVLAGSAGLTSYLIFFGLQESFQDLSTLDLPPLSPDEAVVLVEELLYGESHIPSREVVARILDVVGEPIPYFLHAVVNAVVQEVASDPPLTPESVDRAYRERILDEPASELFRVYSLRDRPYPRALVQAASRLLRELAARPDGMETEGLRQVYEKSVPPEEAEKFVPLLSCLQEDFDLVQRGDRWTMRSKVLRDRWLLRDPWAEGE